MLKRTSAVLLLMVAIFLYCSNPIVPAIINTQPQSKVVVVGDSIEFTVIVTSYSGPTYQWLKKNIPILGDTNATYTISSVTINDFGEYKVIVSNSRYFSLTQKSDTSDPITLTEYVPPAITTQPQPSTVNDSSTVYFSVYATGNPAPSYQWQRSSDSLTWTDIAGATNTDYSFLARLTDSGAFFRAVATNVTDTRNAIPVSVNSDGAKLTVN